MKKLLAGLLLCVSLQAAGGLLVMSPPYSSAAPPSFTNVNSTHFTPGSSQTINCGNNLDWDGSSGVTYAAWIKPDAIAVNLAILQKGFTGTAGWIFYKSGALTMAFIGTGSGGGGTMAFTFACTLNDGNWHHVGFTSDGSKTIAGARGYCDGASQTLVPGSDTLTGTLSTSGNFTLGDDPTNDPFKGNIDEPAKWTSVLTSGNFSTMWHSGGPVIDLASLTPAWWLRMGDTPDTTSTYFDASGNGHDCTPVNIAGGDIGPPVP